VNSSRLLGFGIFVLGGILLFTLGLFLIGNRRMAFSKNFEIYTEFATLSGLQDGSKVRVAGSDAGEITEIEVPGGPASKFRVKMRIIERLHPLVRSDSVATISTEGLVGNKFLQIGAGTEKAPPAAPNTTIPSREPFEFSDLVQQASETVRTINQTTAIVKLQVEQTMIAANDVIKNANQLITNTSDDIETIANSARRTMTDVSSVVNKAKSGEGTVGKLLNDEELYSNISSITHDMSVTSKNIRETSERAKQTIAGFQNKESGQENLMTKLNDTITNANEAMSDMAENAEALKRNFFFRGFFKKRGYYDLDSLSVQDYKQGVLKKIGRAHV